jgi:formylglycine-generating enzyme required for sulfatase activity
MSWCSDPWSDGNPFPDGRVRLLPTPTGEQDLVVLRGGGYWHAPAGSRCAMRYRSNAHSRSQGVGIRLAWSVDAATTTPCPSR